MESIDKMEQGPLKPRVAFLGPFASYSHQAVKSTFLESEWELMPMPTIKDIFEVVHSGDASYGVAPFENSSHGTVMFTLDSLADRNRTCSSVRVCAEIYLDVHHFLLGRRRPSATAGSGGGADETMSPGTSTPTASHPDPLRPRAAPLSSLRHVRRVYSHPQGFGQTAAFLATYLRGADTIDVSSTSRAAELVAADETGTSAAIAGEIAAEMNGLEVLARCIEDREDNTTRFFVIRKEVDEAGELAQEGLDGVRLARPPLPEQLTRRREDGEKAGVQAGGTGPGVTETEEIKETPPFKSLISFTVPTRSPGALADVLDCFRRFQLNLTSINSLPSLIQPFQYLFFVEFEGSKLIDSDGRVKSALEKIGDVTQSWRWLGSWHNQRK